VVEEGLVLVLEDEEVLVEVVKSSILRFGEYGLEILLDVQLVLKFILLFGNDSLLQFLSSELLNFLRFGDGGLDRQCEDGVESFDGLLADRIFILFHFVEVGVQL